jgi:demethylmenaquinone methyltransferase/2-methoxy-6-polyprenyl-1,4-benzoquinol methylase
VTEPRSSATEITSKHPSLPEGAAKTAYVRAMFDTIAPRYDQMNRLITFGLDRGWRRRLLSLLALPPGAVVADLACGTGDLVEALHRGGFRSVGLDLSASMLRHAHPAGAPLVEADAVALPLSSEVLDGVVSGFALRNFTDLGAVFAEMARCLRPSGRLALLDVAIPRAPLVRLGHRWYFNSVVPRIGAQLSDASAYRYLPQSVAYLPSEHELTSMLTAAGFEAIRHRSCTGGIVQIITATLRTTGARCRK